ncbi:MAG: hypothetical protein ACKPKO_32765, partial [Candidatus Fonsibacter sp.]
ITVSTECLTVRGQGSGTTSRRHKDTAQRRPPKGREGRRFRHEEMYKVPEDIISEICTSIANSNNNPVQ